MRAIACLVLLLSGSAFGAVQPQPNVNGYTSPYQNPILFPGDTCDPTWTGPMCITHPVLDETPTALSCAGASAQNPNDANQYIIRDTGGFARINAGPEYEFFVCPGDYISTLASFAQTRGGTADTDGGLLKIVYWSNAAGFDPRISAYGRRKAFAEAQNPPKTAITLATGAAANVEALVPRWVTQDVVVSFTYMAGLTWDHPTGTNNPAISRSNTAFVFSFGVYFDRVYLDSERFLSNNSWQLRYLDGAVVQNSAVGPGAKRMNEDNSCIWIWEYSRDVRIVEVDTWDCTHNIATGGNVANGNGEGTIIDANTSWISELNYIDECTNAYWTNAYADGAVIDRSTEQAFNTDGNCACNESQMSFKKGSSSAANPLLFINNVMLGNRSGSNTECGGTGMTRGHAIESFVDPANMYAAYNIISGGAQWLIQGDDKGNPGGAFTNILWEANYFINLGVYDTAFSDPPTRAFSQTWLGNPEWRYNWFGPVPPANADFGDAGLRVGTFNCNIYFDTRNQTNGTNLVGDSNIALETTPGTVDIPNFTNTTTLVYDADDYADFTITIKRSTDPELFTVENVVPISGRAGGVGTCPL